jgi:hypothetical protein
MMGIPQKVARLESLLARVKQRAAEPRVVLRAAAPAAPTKAAPVPTKAQAEMMRPTPIAVPAARDLEKAEESRTSLGQAAVPPHPESSSRMAVPLQVRKPPESGKQVARAPVAPDSGVDIAVTEGVPTPAASEVTRPQIIDAPVAAFVSETAAPAAERTFGNVLDDALDF